MTEQEKTDLATALRTDVSREAHKETSESRKWAAKLESLKPGLENSNSSAEDALVDMLPRLIAFLKSA